MTLTVYNTLTRSKSAFQTIEENKVRMYCCASLFMTIAISVMQGLVWFGTWCVDIYSGVATK